MEIHYYKIEKESELGFYAYYVSNFCGVVVLKEDFSLEEGLADRSLEEYIGNVITNNGHTGIEPQNKDDLWFYVRDNNGTRSYSYSYKGSNAFWVVQFLCMTSDAPKLEDQFCLWANSVEVEQYLQKQVIIPHFHKENIPLIVKNEEEVFSLMLNVEEQEYDCMYSVLSGTNTVDLGA